MGDALINMLSVALGDRFTPEMRQCWHVVYALMSTIMVSTLPQPCCTPLPTEHITTWLCFVGNSD